MKKKRGMRWHKGSDGWGRDSYAIPQFAVVGASDCGMWSDSPAPTDLVKDELDQFRKWLKTVAGIKSRLKYTSSGNVFMAKRWVVVSESDFEKAADIARAWLKTSHSATRYVHDADLGPAKEVEVVA